jgi:hypothetical protein
MDSRLAWFAKKSSDRISHIPVIRALSGRYLNQADGLGGIE